MKREMSTEEMAWWAVGIVALGVGISQAGRLYRLALAWAEDHQVLAAKDVVWALPQAGTHGLDPARLMILAGAVVLVAAIAGLALRGLVRSKNVSVNSGMVGV